MTASHMTGADDHTLTAVTGLAVGHWTDLEAATGCTVVLCGQDGAVAGVDVRGSAPGTRETDLLAPLNLIDRVHAVLLTGGSAFGLDAAGGVMRWLEERQLGCDMGVCRVPLVSAAVLFDLGVGRADVRPGAAAGYAACEAASTAAVPRGSVGAGTGATVGKVLGPERATKGGVGSAAARLGGGAVVAALVAVNAGGDVIDPGSGDVVAGARGDDGRFVRAARLLHEHDGALRAPGEHTTLAVVATDAVLTKVEATKMAQMAHDGLARAIDPVHTMYDGDTVFALATGSSGRTIDVSLAGTVAAHVLADAVVDAVRSATSLAGLPAARDVLVAGGAAAGPDASAARDAAAADAKGAP
jgi:L-aminopeptidase/D-esterase-like protein